MFYKILIIVVIINTKSLLCDPLDPLKTSTNQSNDNIDGNERLNSSGTDDKPIESDSDLQHMNDKNGSNDTTINKTIVEPIVNDLPSVPPPSEANDMLSFEEWRKKIAEKSVQQNADKPLAKSSSQTVPQSPQSVPAVVQSSVTTKQKTNTKRSRNFGSYECGAKVVDSNPESESVQRILNEQMDEYMLNPCKAKIWFVIELCETIQPKSIELANFELYSSVPKEFNIQASDHYPTREWSSLGTFSSLDERSVQRFSLQDNGFVKFIKIEMLSHYGSEHFCPLSVVRVFGTSLFEEVERMDNMGNQMPSIDEDESPLTEELVGEEQSSQNLFGTARDAVFNIVRKAAQALNGNNNEVLESGSNENKSSIVNALVDYNLLAIHLYPKVDKYLINCSKTCNYYTNCLYIKSLFGQTLYELLVDQYLSVNVMNASEKHLLFQCDSQLKNSSNLSLKLESSSEFESNFGFISPTKPIELKTNAFENNTLDSVYVIKTSDESHISVTPTQLSEEVSTSSESSFSSSITSESNASDIKSEELSAIQDMNNKEMNESEIIGSKGIEVLKNLSTNDMTVPNGVHTTGSNGYAISGGQSKESVVIRLTNRIKALEVNLSLSSQYLEELSLRYRKQMEEMQRAFNTTISKLNDTNNRATERDLKQQESIASLETKLNSLNSEMSDLLRERESLNWHYIEVHIALMMIEVIVVIVFLFICVHRLQQRIQYIQTSSKLKTSLNIVSTNKRSHPNSNPCHLPTKALKIEDDNKAMDSLINNDMNKSSNPQSTQRKIRKKKKRMIALNGIHLSNSLESDAFGVKHTDSPTNCSQHFKQSLIPKSQSTPVLSTRPLASKHLSQTNGPFTARLTNGSSCHSSTSGVSSNSTISVLTTKHDIKCNNECNQKSLTVCKTKTSDKSNSLTLSLKKLLKFDKKYV